MQHSPRSKIRPSHSRKTRLSFQAIGTHWHIEYSAALSKAGHAKLDRHMHERIETFDTHYSRFRSDSLVYTISQQHGTYTLPDDAKPLLELYYNLYQVTDGLFTPLIGQTLSDAGYDAQYSLKTGMLSRPPDWDDAMDYSFPLLKTKQKILLDFGALGKGYLVDLIAGLLHDHGVQSFVINAGGDIIHKGSKPLQVALEHPGDAMQAIGVATIQNTSICGSAGNRRAWGKFHHIIDPVRLVSPKHIRSSWVTADTTILADALATCLFFVLPDKLRKHYTFEYAIVYDDYSLEHSSDFPAEFF